MRILLLLSGVYPHYMGGVSTWTNQLVSKMRDFEFIIISVVSNPHVEIRYPIPPNVKEIVTIPLWGSDRPEEYEDRPLHSIIKRNRKTSENAIESSLKSASQGA